jgi:hypothetical protein
MAGSFSGRITTQASRRWGPLASVEVPGEDSRSVTLDPVVAVEYAIAGDEAALAGLGAEVAAVGVGDDRAGVVAGGEGSPDELVEPELLGSGDLDDAVERFAHGDPAERGGDVACGGRVDAADHGTGPSGSGLRRGAVRSTSDASAASRYSPTRTSPS